MQVRLCTRDKMFKIINPGLSFLAGRVVRHSVRRCFLSKAYRCDEAWESRLKNPAFQKIDPNNLYHELDLSFIRKKRISTLDVDLFVNSVTSTTLRNELDDVLLQIRLCPECGILPERVTHAAIRWYIDNVPSRDLFNALSDRLSYGLFPDHHLTNVLMDKYLKEKDSVSAVKAAVLQMLQEDLDNPIMKALALHCCYNYLESPDVWKSYKEPEPDPDEEVRKVRVNYLRNPYFDDHFDIKDTNHLVGKTLWMFGCAVDGTIGLSSQLVGLVLYEKHQKGVEFLQKVSQDKVKLHAEAVDKCKEYLLKKPKQDEEPEKEPDEWKTKLSNMLESMSGENLVKGSLLTESAEYARRIIAENESNDIQHQCQVYKQWEEDRENHIQMEIQRAEVRRVQSEIEETKAKLAEEEEKLFFFDNEEEYDLIAKEKEKQMGEVFYYKERRRRQKVEEEYIPPDVKKKFGVF